MVFSSIVFLWVFLPIVFIINYFIRSTAYSNLFLMLASLVFYAWGEPVWVLLMLLCIVVNYLVGIGIHRFEKYKKCILILGILFDLSTIGWFKYSGFFVQNLNRVFGKELIPVPVIALPIGISFFTFQAISYIIDVYRKDVEAQPRLVNTALYISFFPQLIAGPIVKYREIDKQIEARCITPEGIALGFRRFIYGLSKKVLISNVLGQCVDMIYAYDIAQVDGCMAWVAAITYTFQIYYDFSGYSDMAIGLGQMFGFTIPENFHYPYLSTSISEFWRRWHISLGSWFREYLYIPLGGNRKGKVRTYINLVIVFFLTGLWHGASFSFILWGLYHGFFRILERIGFKKITDRIKPLGWLYCFMTVNFGWVLFRAKSTRLAVSFILRMVMPWKYAAVIARESYMDHKLVFFTICAIAGAGLIRKWIPEKIAAKWRNSVPEAVYCIFLLVLCMASIASGTYNPFIYFQF